MGKRTVARLRAIARNVHTSTSILLWSCTATAIGLLIASFITPPPGEIHPSVLKGGSLIFAFAALALLREAIMEGLGFKLTHGDTSVIVQDMNGPHHEEASEETQINEES